MPLTKFQQKIARLLAQNRTPDSYLAGGAAVHIAPQSKRYSNDLDFFHDSVERVASAYRADEELLKANGYVIQIEMNQPGFLRAIVRKKSQATKIEWAHDSAWRFMPPLLDEEVGVRLHPIDLAINKLLALAGRDEARDFLDIIHVHTEILPLGPLCWAAVGKDPGFTPPSLLELIKRRGRYRPEDFSRLLLKQPIDLVLLKKQWREAIEQAEAFVSSRPTSEAGCLYYSKKAKRFVDPKGHSDAVPHYGRPGGVLPRVYEGG